MKKEWKKPELEILDVNMTMHNPKVGDHIDQTFAAGTPFNNLRWS